jgi:hypothetical protein
LNIDFIRQGKVCVKKPVCEITICSKGKFVNAIIIKNTINRSENIKNNYCDAKG